MSRFSDVGRVNIVEMGSCVDGGHIPFLSFKTGKSSMLQAVITALPILILEINKGGIILDVSSDSPSFFGVELESVLNKPVNAFFPEQVKNNLETALHNIEAGKQPPIINYTLKVDEAEQWFEARFIKSTQTNTIVIIQEVTRYKTSELKTQKQLDQMSTLQAIDHAIASSVDLNVTLSILLTKLVKHLHIDAACILLWNAGTKRLEYGAGLGFRTGSLAHMKLKIGEGYAGVAALEQRIIKKVNLNIRQTDFLRYPTFRQEGFVSYLGVPLVAKGQVKGVLEIFSRSLINPDAEWTTFLKMLGGQAAIAIDNASLFYELQQSNAELTSAYDATIEGWSRALDMRDHDTEGHTKRVVEMTMDLARKINTPNSDLIHLRRGAALHDIGKMGIPDQILHKPGQLSDEEWKIMRQHPQYACELLSPIEYLRPAKDIPCYHHERWNGSGYPSGLKRDEIPLPARLFAVVDVFDALTSDRPYRSAWSKQAAQKYIQEQAGILFDPMIALEFLEMLREQGLND